MNSCKTLVLRVPFEKRAGKKLFSIASFISTNNSSKPKVVIIGAGWAGYRVGLDIDKNKYDVHLISPRNHFLFTPLLPSTAVGTLEFRAIQEPVRTIPKMNYIQAQVESINFDSKVLKCSDVFTQNREFSISYDTLVLAPGAETNTLNVPGVTNNENVFFLKQLSHSRAIRNRLLDCFERASSPLVESNAEKRNLLNFMIVGGGPTSVEFAAELYDFLKEDVAKWYPDLLPFTKVRIVEASGHILGSFNSSLVGYVESLFKKRNIELLTGTVVKEVKENFAILSDGSRLPFGLMVWSTGIKQVPLIQNIPADLVSKFPNGRLKVDSHLRLLQQGKDLPIGDGSVFAIGDCAGDSVKPLPPLAQVRNYFLNIVLLFS